MRVKKKIYLHDLTRALTDSSPPTPPRPTHAHTLLYDTDVFNLLRGSAPCVNARDNHVKCMQLPFS